MHRSSQYGASFGALVVEAKELAKLVPVMTVAPRRMMPLALTENWVIRVPSNQKSKPIGANAELPSSELAAISCAVPDDMSSSATPVDPA